MALPLAWPCVDMACGNVLGSIAMGELAIDKDNCAAINTDGVNVILTCQGCGKPKTWFAKAPAVESAFIDTLAQKLARLLDSRRR